MDSTPPRFLARFSRAERAVHWTLAALMLTCILTAAVLYNGSLSLAVGHRHVVELVHVYSGLALPVPLLAGVASVAYRADLRRLNRFSPYDWQWLRSGRARRAGSLPVGKFNAGQKLNAALSCGAILVLFGTGLLMYLTGLAPLSWRTGATLVHDWFALAVGLLVLGHIWYALRDPDAMAGMIRGRVPATWARAEHPAWTDQPDHTAADRARAGGAAPER